MKTSQSPYVAPGAQTTLNHAKPMHASTSQSRCRRVPALLAGVLMLACCRVATAQTNYAINWFKIAGGGGTSTGSVYAVRGTIGQPDAGALTNGAYRLVGGFWSVVAAIQTPGAPLLSITRTATNTVAISWPSTPTGYVLQQNPDLNGPTNWLDVAQAASDNGTTKTVIVNPPVGKMFYRLLKR